MYKDHPDVYYFFIEGVEQKLLNSEVLGGHKTIELLLYK